MENMDTALVVLITGLVVVFAALILLTATSTSSLPASARN